jgi:hypothetical protein
MRDGKYIFIALAMIFYFYYDGYRNFSDAEKCSKVLGSRPKGIYLCPSRVDRVGAL